MALLEILLGRSDGQHNVTAEAKAILGSSSPASPASPTCGIPGEAGDGGDSVSGKLSSRAEALCRQATVERSDLVRRYRDALPWLIDCQPQNVAALRAEDDAGADPDRMRAIMEAGVEAYDRSLSGDAILISSRLLGQEVWLVESDTVAAELARKLEHEQGRRPIFTLAEVERLQGMAEADLLTIARVKRHFPGSGVQSVTLTQEDA